MINWKVDWHGTILGLAWLPPGQESLFPPKRHHIKCLHKLHWIIQWLGCFQLTNACLYCLFFNRLQRDSTVAFLWTVHGRWWPDNCCTSLAGAGCLDDCATWVFGSFCDQTSRVEMKTIHTVCVCGGGSQTAKHSGVWVSSIVAPSAQLDRWHYNRWNPNAVEYCDVKEESTMESQAGQTQHFANQQDFLAYRVDHKVGFWHTVMWTWAMRTVAGGQRVRCTYLLRSLLTPQGMLAAYSGLPMYQWLPSAPPLSGCPVPFVLWHSYPKTCLHVARAPIHLATLHTWQACILTFSHSSRSHNSPRKKTQLQTTCRK